VNTGERLLAANGIVAPKRVLLVKQDVHNDLYYEVSPASPEAIVYSSIMRSGPVGLFTALDADFVVVKTDPAPECNTWLQKVTDCKHQPVEFYESLRGQVSRYRQVYDHARVSKNVDDVDWGKYDIVITIDIAVPTRIVEKHPNTVWAYYVSEPCMSLYRDSLIEPQFGYDLFFTLGFQPQRPHYASNRVLEFPYFLQYAGCFADLDGIANPPFEARTCVSTEKHSFKLWTPEQLGLVESIAGPVKKGYVDARTKISDLRAAKYHLRTDGKAIWGNSLIEAAAAGAFVISTPTLLKHRLIVPDLKVETFEDMLKVIARLENDPEFRASCIDQQNRMLDDICFVRPMRELTAALERL
jgi:hypothetical protein